MPPRIRPDVARKFDSMIGKGEAVAVAARECGVSYGWAKERAKGRRKRDQAKFYANEADNLLLPDVASPSQLSEPAKRALVDFEFFRERFIGKRSMPWQVEAANTVVELLATPQKEFVVINVPPGAGKSTLFTHDIVLWLICRNRALRALIGSEGERLARQYTGRLMDSLERTTPYLATDTEKRAGAIDAVSTVTADYGRFKPTTPKVWRREELTVAQPNDIAASDKESTLSAYGKDGGVLGGRFDFIVWDDLVTRRNMRSAEMREEMKEWWKSTAETRLEPGGVLLLVGQRLGSDDLYRFALDMRDVAFDEVTGEELDESEATPKYRHIKFKAHYDELCVGKHWRDMEPYPQGCLLDPYRLSWRDLARTKRNGIESFLVNYQQEDVDPADVLVQKVWVAGGVDDRGVEHPGCWDNERRLWELPKNLTGDVFVYGTADPSPSKFWSVQVWAYHPDTEQRFLLELVRQKMTAPELLDWDEGNGAFVGLMHEWTDRSRRLGMPIRYWIVERNAAQRFLLQYDHVKRWLRLMGDVQIIGHDTHAQNRSDPNMGVQSLALLYRSGRVRLPGFQQDGSRMASLKLVEEVTKWPQGSTDDCVMAQWFGEWNLQTIYVPPEASNIVRFRPGFVRAHGRTNAQALAVQREAARHREMMA